MNNDYEKRLSKAVEKLGEAQKQAKDALAEIDTAAGELLHRGAPALIEEQHADIVDATDHVKGIMARFEVINVGARAGIVELGNVRKMANKVSFGMSKLFAETIAAGEEERTRRQRRQTTIPGVDAPPRPKKEKPEQEQAAAPSPLRMPRGLGFCTGILEEIDAELGSDGPPLDLEELGYRLAKRQGAAVLDVPSLITEAAEDSDNPPPLTQEERIAFTAGVARALAQSPAQELAGASRAPRDVPRIAYDVVRDRGLPPTLRALGYAMARDSYLIGDEVDGVTQAALDELKDGDDFALTDAETAELRAGIAEGIAAEEAEARGEAPAQGLTGQTAAASLPVFIARARQIGKADGARKPGKPGLHARARFDGAAELWDSPIFAPPAELAPSKEVLFAAYEESYEAAKPKRGRPKKAKQAGGEG